MVEELKAKAYDIDRQYAEWKKQMDALIKEAEEKVASYGGETKTEEVVEEVSTEVSVQEPVVQPEVSEVAPVIPVEEVPQAEETQAPVVSEEPVVQPEVSEVAPVIPVEEVPQTEETQAPVVSEEPVVQPEPEVSIPVVQPVETSEVVEQPKEEGIGEQELDQTPLTPAGIEPTKYERISITGEQAAKLESSKEAQKAKVLAAMNNTVVETPVVEQPVVANVTEVPAPAVESSEDLERQMQEMVNELATVTDEAKATELNMKIAELNEKRKQLVKIA